MVDLATPSTASASIYGKVTLQEGNDYFVTPSFTPQAKEKWAKKTRFRKKRDKFQQYHLNGFWETQIEF
jgi:hypothetical protein